MEGKAVLIEKILSDARQEADKIVAEANDYATATLDKARAQAKDKVSVAEKAAETAGVEYVGRRITVAGLDLKKAKLNAKIALLDDVYDKAADAVRNVPDKDYKNLIEGMLDSAAEDGDVVTISKNDAKVLTKAFFDSYSKKRGINLSLSKDLGDFKGGVVLSGGGVDKNLTLEVEIKLLREQTESEIAGLLFKGV